MATDIVAPGAGDRDDRERGDRPDRSPPPQRPAATEGGFFTIYKKGQGKWTRLGTAAGAGLIGALSAHFLYTEIPGWMMAGGADPGTARNVGIGVAAGFLAAYALLAFWLMNKASNAEFLIATDSEMKKVNWTSRKELIGSTKVVILFMFLIAAILFVIDIVFGYFFYLVDVLKTKPF